MRQAKDVGVGPAPQPRTAIVPFLPSASTRTAIGGRGRADCLASHRPFRELDSKRGGDFSASGVIAL